MNKLTISIGRILGIPLELDFSWIVVFALLAWTMAALYFPSELVLSTATYGVFGAVAAILFFVSVLLHELGHASVARRYQIPVRRITLYAFGGAAELGEAAGPRAEVLIAVAGPVVSGALAAAFGFLAISSARFAPVFAWAKYLAIANSALALVNLIPVLPLDGGHVLHSIIWQFTGSPSRATHYTATRGRMLAFVFILAGVWQLLSGNVVGLWFALAAWLVQGAAAQQLKQQDYADLLTNLPPAAIKNRGYVQVPAESPLQELVEQQLLNVAARGFVVRQNGAAVGLLTWYHINAVPRRSWRTTTAAQAMTPVNIEQFAGMDETTRSAPAEAPIVARGRPPA